ncbi:MAG TPA: phage tail tape measure protein, partial [Nannocystis sp.]
ALGLKAKIVAENVTSRDALTRANQMREVVERIGQLGDAERVSVMSRLFGKETLGTIGPLATNLELLTESLELAGDKTKALGSVQAEFQSRSATTANTLQLLKNSVSVTAITIGNELLPEISVMAKDLAGWVKQNRELIKDNVVGFVHGLRDAVKGIAPYVAGTAKLLGTVVEMLGGVERAIGPVTVGLGALRVASTLALGPWGVLAAGIIAGAVAIKQEMADAERRTMSLIQAAGRLKDVRMTGFGLETKSAQELLKMQEDLTAERKKAATISGTSKSGRFLSPSELAQAEKERQADLAAIDERSKLIRDALSTKTKELETSINIRKESERAAAAEQLRSDKLKLELEYLNSLDKLSAAQARRKKALEKVGVEAEEPAAKKGRGGRGPKKTGGEMLDPGDVRIARTFDGTGQTEEVASGAVEAAAAGAAEAEQRRFQEQMLRFEREQEMLDASGLREEEAELRRADLQNRRMAREEEYAKFQLNSATDEASREAARTKLETVEHNKRVAGLKNQV